MNRSTEQALTSLIPRLNGPLPIELLDLASSLVAQSRNRASNLKADEEIGRVYACANIACERLKQQLNLPQIEPRPPCPPKVYKKLYSYLDTLLAAQKRTRSSLGGSAPNTPSKTIPSRPTPTKERSLAQFKQATPSRTPTRQKRATLQYGTSRDISVWIGPVVRRLCQESHAPAAIPSVLAGVESVLNLPSPEPTERVKEPPSLESDFAEDLPRYKTPALIATIYFFVKTKLLGKEMNGRDYSAEKKTVLDILERARNDEDLKSALAKKVKKGEEWMSDWERIGRKDVDVWIAEIAGKGWLELDWFLNIIQGHGVEIQGREEADIEMKDKGQNVDKDVLQAGLGTMMQDKIDYLSERKREDYKAWKDAMLTKISELEVAANNDVEMED